MSTSEVLSPRIDVSVLLETPGSVLDRHGLFQVPDGFDLPLVTFPETLTGDLVIEGLLEGVLVRGQVEMDFGVQCADCLEPTDQHFAVAVTELFTQDEDGEEGFMIGPDLTIDLDPLWRDLIAEQVQARYLCRPDCKGLCVSCGTNRNEHPCACEDVRTDLRWQALAGMTFPDADEA